MPQPIKVVVVVVFVVVLVKIRSLIAETTLSSIVSQPVTVDVFVFVVDAEDVVVFFAFVVVVFVFVVNLRNLHLKFGENWVGNS